MDSTTTIVNGTRLTASWNLPKQKNNQERKLHYFSLLSIQKSTCIYRPWCRTPGFPQYLVKGHDPIKIEIKFHFPFKKEKHNQNRKKIHPK